MPDPSSSTIVHGPQACDLKRTIAAIVIAALLTGCGGGADSAPPVPAPVAQASEAFIHPANYSAPGGSPVLGTFTLTDTKITFAVDGGNVQSISRSDVTGVTLTLPIVTIATALTSFSIELLKPDSTPDVAETYALADLLALACARAPTCAPRS